ncbi:efflux RND transporter periplasmic adaptor subunit [Methylobacterium mesophilicum SR1.6/6]|uniref:Efflux RND transporter periplasmic adaptor subunit n=1 Tax=Methylobacterium mesophilicum SR1.6/6 TaxID=908290 RepID=A0A6B9FNR2_9HYPH|nr:efflux RND transporter periplasmic adaptor subunit [Methylobacterium mesophilicum]QGY02834.1 efflux RND transporter periplasmic adaptor subunit [Methylobacterium mesophilicum SR1.6/6]
MSVRSLITAGVLVSILGGCHERSDETEQSDAGVVRPVLTRVAEATDTITFGPFAGTVEPRYQAQLGFQIPGRMIARDVTVGDIVKKGQRLAALDVIVTRFDLTRAEADLADARAQAENAEAAEARTRRLMTGNSVAQATLDQAVAKRETARARVDQALASLQKARDQMGYTELKAEFDGVVTQRLAEVGQVLSAGQGVVTVARPDVREAVVDIPEVHVGAMPADGIFTVALQSAPDVTARGRIREVAPLAESGTRSKRIRLTLEDPNPAFRLGATINVSLTRTVPAQILLPASALLEDGERRSVWVVSADGRSVTRRDVSLAAVRSDEGERIAVTAGLRPGDRVVIAGVHALTEGQAVRLTDDAV